MTWGCYHHPQPPQTLYRVPLCHQLNGSVWAGTLAVTQSRCSVYKSLQALPSPPGGYPNKPQVTFSAAVRGTNLAGCVERVIGEKGVAGGPRWFGAY